MNITYATLKTALLETRGEVLQNINWYKEVADIHEPEIAVVRIPVSAFLVLNLDTNTTEIVFPDQIKTAAPLCLTVDLLNQ